MLIILVVFGLESYANWSYVYNLMLQLELERQYRYKHKRLHKSIADLYLFCVLDTADIILPHSRFTEPALAMPVHCKIPGNPVESYRKYYKEEKQHLHKWTNREIPYWLGE